MKKIVIGIVVVLLAVSVFVIIKNRENIVKALSKATFDKISEEVLTSGMTKSTFQTTDKVGIDMEISIIANESMVLGDMKKDGDKTIAVFQPKK